MLQRLIWQIFTDVSEALIALVIKGLFNTDHGCSRLSADRAAIFMSELMTAS
jgi:hypothetical protein